MENREIPKGWRETTLGEVVSLAQGVAINAKTNHVLCDESEGLPLLKINNLVNNTVDQYANPVLVPQKAILEKDDIIFTRTGQVGWVFTGKSGILHNNSFKVIPNDSIHGKYLYWFLKNDFVFDYVQKVASGSAQPDLNHDAFKTIVFLYPESYEEQVAIGQVLSSLDEKIELLEEENKTLETLVQTIFTEWFVNFNFPGATGEMEDSELGEIPKGWRVGKLGEVAKNVSRRFNFKDKDDVVFVNTGDVLNGKFLHNNYISTEGLPGQAKKAIEKGDILYSEIRPVNRRFARVDKDVDNYVVSTKFMVIQRNDLVGYNFLYLLLTSDVVLREFQVIAESRSGTFPQITFDSIEKLEFALPENKELMLLFEEAIENIYLKMMINDEQIQTLKTTRDTLLPKLTTGEIRVEGFGE